MSQWQQEVSQQKRCAQQAPPRCIPSTHGKALWEELADKRRLWCESGACGKTEIRSDRVRGSKTRGGCRCQKCSTVGGVRVCKSCCSEKRKHNAAYANALKPLKSGNPRKREVLQFSGPVPRVPRAALVNGSANSCNDPMRAFTHEVVESCASKGRIAVATRALAPGDMVLTEHAVACVAASTRSLCDDCLKPIGEGVQCVACRTEHNSCARPSTELPSVRLSAKLLWRRCAGSLGRENASKLDSLIHDQHKQTPATRHKQYTRTSKEEDIAQIVKLAAAFDTRAEEESLTSFDGCLHLLSNCGSGRTVVDILQLAKVVLGRVALNAFTTCDEGGATGLGLFTAAAMFNHSCCPNIQAWWRGPKLEYRCTKDVSLGEELCVSYISIDQPSTVRREQLRRNWLFDCSCERCQSRRWDTELTGLRCPVKACAGAVPPSYTEPSCNQCGANVAGHVVEDAEAVSSEALQVPHRRASYRSEWPHGAHLRKASQLFKDGMEAYMREDAETALVAIEKCLGLRESVLHPFNKELLRTLRYASYAAVATQNWAKARSFLLRWLKPMDTMYGAAEIWDVAAMRIDMGLVLEKLDAAQALAPSAGAELGANGVVSVPARGMHPIALAELTRGLQWLRICLGRDTGLPAERAALETFSLYRGMHPIALAELTRGLQWLRICLGRDTGLPAERAALETFSLYNVSL